MMPAIVDQWIDRIPIRHRITLSTIAMTALGLLAMYIAVGAQQRLAFLLLGGLGAFLVAFFGGTPVALALYFFTTLGNEVKLPLLPVSGNRLAAGLLFLAIVMEVPWKKWRWNSAWFGVIFLLFNVYYLIMAGIKKPPDGAFPVESIFYLIIFSLIVIRYWEEKYLRLFLGSVVIMSFFSLTLPGLFEAVTGRNIFTHRLGGAIGRINGFSNNAIIYGYTTLWGIPFALFFMMEGRNQVVKFVSSLFAILAVGAVLLTFNRQSPILMAFTLFSFFLLIRSPLRKYLIIGSLALGVIATPLVGAKIVERFSEARSIQRDPSLTVRHDKFQIAQEMIEKNFWTGIGHNYFPKLHDQYFPKGEMYLLQFLFRRDRYIDLGYLQIMTEYGMIGATMVFGFFVFSGIYLLKMYRRSLYFEDSFYTNAVALIVSLYVLLLVSMLIQDTFVTPRTYFMVALLLAIGTAINLKLEKLINEEDRHREPQ